MTKQTTWWIAGIATLILAATSGLVAAVTQEPNPGFKDATATLTFITGAAIAIERIIEALWTFLGGIWGTYWPLNTITRQVKTMVEDLDTALKPFHEKAQLRLDQLEQQGKLTKEQLTAGEKEIERMKARFDELMRLTPDNQRIQLLAAAASQNVAYLYKKYGEILPQLKQASDTANTAINGLQDFLATFKDNPGRRLISIYLGAVLGLGVAGLFSLDVFQAVLQTPAQEATGGLLDACVLLDVRVIFTGLVIGLGSNPTHEVIRAIQEYKEGRKGANIAHPNLPPEKSSDGRTGRAA
jgi:hypothetical protein